MAAAVGAVYHNLGSGYGHDFRGVFDAARSIRAGVDPYVGSTVSALRHAGNPYVLPPLLAELTVPLTALPFGAAIAFLDAVSLAAIIAALWLLDVRDPRVLVIAVCSLPVVDTVVFGQPNAVFALALVVAWRWRDGWPAPIAVAVLIACKLLLWPLLLWFVVTRRYASAALAAVVSMTLVAGSWALISFHGIHAYAHRLSLDAHAFGFRSHSVAAVASRLGAGLTASEIVGALLGAAIALAVARAARFSDLGTFTAAILAGLLITPLLWTHYLVVLLVPLAIARTTLDRAWLATIALYLSPTEPPAHGWQMLLVAIVACGLALGAVTASANRVNQDAAVRVPA